MGPEYKNFKEFYPAYLMDHANPHSRKVHFLGFASFLIGIGVGYATGEWLVLFLGIALGYALSWVGHYYFEKNKPTTFGKPYWSMRAGRRMFLEMLIGRLDMRRDWNKTGL
jgi:hypothetical protein